MPTPVRKAQIVHFALCEYVTAEEYERSGRLPVKENNGKLPGWGWKPDLDDEVAFDRNRWDWRMDASLEPRFAIFSWDRVVRFAAEISKIEIIPRSRKGLKKIEGHVLGEEHHIYHQYVGQPSPEWSRGRSNPRYLYK